MKKLNKYKSLALSLVITMVALQGCIDEAPDIGEPFDRLSNLAGTWELQKLTLNDEDAVRKGFPAFVQSVDITNLYPFTDVSLTLNLDEEGNPSTFEVNTGGAPNYFGAESGSWSVDDLGAPAEINFAGGNTIELTTYLGLTEGALTVKFVRYETRSNGDRVSFLSYEYEFVKQ